MGSWGHTRPNCSTPVVTPGRATASELFSVHHLSHQAEPESKLLYTSCHTRPSQRVRPALHQLSHQAEPENETCSTPVVTPGRATESDMLYTSCHTGPSQSQTALHQLSHQAEPESQNCCTPVVTPGRARESKLLYTNMLYTSCHTRPSHRVRTFVHQLSHQVDP